jgi:hypothetical protein
MAGGHAGSCLLLMCAMHGSVSALLFAMDLVDPLRL